MLPESLMQNGKGGRWKSDMPEWCSLGFVITRLLCLSLLRACFSQLLCLEMFECLSVYGLWLLCTHASAMWPPGPWTNNSNVLCWQNNITWGTRCLLIGRFNRMLWSNQNKKRLWNILGKSSRHIFLSACSLLNNHIRQMTYHVRPSTPKHSVTMRPLGLTTVRIFLVFFNLSDIMLSFTTPSVLERWLASPQPRPFCNRNLLARAFSTDTMTSVFRTCSCDEG